MIQRSIVLQDTQISRPLTEFNWERIPDVVRRVADRLTSYIETLRSRVDRRTLIYLKRVFSSLRHHRINYDLYAEPFAYSYFMENYWKAAFTFLKEGVDIKSSITDAGSGSGASILAYLAVADSRLTGEQFPISVTLLDRSKKQLKLASKMLTIAENELQHLKIKPNYHHIDLCDWQPQERSVHTLLLGHVMTENPKDIPLILDKAFSAVTENGCVYIIERTHDDIWDRLDQCLRDAALPTFHGRIEQNIGEWDLRKPSELGRHGPIRTRYAVVSIPAYKGLVTLLKLYFRAWEHKSLADIEELFSNDARYHDKPFTLPYANLEQIKTYWKDNVLIQSDIRLHVLRVAYTRNEAFAEWEAQFIQHGNQTKLKGMLVLIVDVDNGQVAELREYYQSQRSET
jgi:ubiquinone/menaquinone biosynthesis C-methylase UbiE